MNLDANATFLNYNVDQTFAKLNGPSQINQVSFLPLQNAFLLCGSFVQHNSTFGLARHFRYGYELLVPMASGYVQFAADVGNGDFLLYGHFVPFFRNLPMKLAMYVDATSSWITFQFSGVINAMKTFISSSTNVTVFGGSFSVKNCVNYCIYRNNDLFAPLKTVRGNILHIAQQKVRQILWIDVA
jgi:hypothetical protein